MPCDARKTPYLVEKHGVGKKNVLKPGISIIKCISVRKKTLFGDQNFVSGDLFTGASEAWGYSLRCWEGLCHPDTETLTLTAAHSHTTPGL